MRRDNTSLSATITEMGNGLPTVGDYVPGDDGGLYRIATLDGPIHTGRSPGAGNYVHASVEPADWEDCEEDDVYPARATVDAEEDEPTDWTDPGAT